MLNTERICPQANNSNLPTTYAHETGNPFSFDESYSFAGGNLYLIAITKAMYEFVQEEARGNINTELRLTKKIEAARTLFPEDKSQLRNLSI